jgi:two-component system, OmpR family, KDP operon response regulator KdpE
VVDLLVALDRVDRVLVGALAALAENGIKVRVSRTMGDVAYQARALQAQAVVLAAPDAEENTITRLQRANASLVLIAWVPSASSVDIAALLDLGADEVVHPGMRERELRARIAAALRRGGRPPVGALDAGPLSIDALHGEATWEGRDLKLTRREREVLEVLAEHAGRTVRREVVYRRVWGYAMARGERSVDVNVTRLRRKLETTAGTAVQIKAQPGIGYRLELVSERDPVTAL